MDLLGCVHPPPSPGQRVCRGGGYFHDKAKNIRDKMSNLSNNMMISELFVNKNYNTVIKQDFAVVK